VIFCLDWMPAGVKVVGREAMQDAAWPALEIAVTPPASALWVTIPSGQAAVRR
jgi:hypothetical protein